MEASSTLQIILFYIGQITADSWIDFILKWCMLNSAKKLFKNQLDVIPVEQLLLTFISFKPSGP